MNNRILDIIEQHESSRIEFKTNFNSDVVETICAFSNTIGGSVFIGISDKGKIIGVENLQQELIKNWINIIKTNTLPQLFPEILIHDIENKKIAELIVQEYPVKPVACRGKFFKRYGSSNHLLKANEIAELQILSINSSFDSFVIDDTIQSLENDLIDKFFKELRNRNRIQLTDNNFINLEKLGLIKNSKLTFASLLLFGNHNTGIHIGRFKDRDIIIDDILLKSPIIDAVDIALRFIQKNISVSYTFENQLKRIENWQYPIPVIRELLLNSIIHRDYQSQNDIMIKIFDNSIEFINPGKLLGNLKIEDLFTDYYTAVHRNKLLCEAFYLLGEVEKYDTGFIRIRKLLEDYPNIRLEIDNSSSFVKVTLTITDVGINVGINVGKDVGKGINQTVNEILKRVTQDTTITIPELSEQTGLTNRTIERSLAKLKKLNIIRRIGGRKNGSWEVNKHDF